MNCPNCGNGMFDQGLQLVYCGACGNFERREDMENPLPLKEQREEMRQLVEGYCEAETRRQHWLEEPKR